MLKLQLMLFVSKLDISIGLSKLNGTFIKISLNHIVLLI